MMGSETKAVHSVIDFPLPFHFAMPETPKHHMETPPSLILELGEVTLSNYSLQEHRKGGRITGGAAVAGAE